MKLRSVFISTFMAAALFASTSVFAADPSLHEIYQAANAGNLKQAEAMIDQVLRDHPNSAKAHFVDAELLAKGGKVDMARAELATAERLAPGLPFAAKSSVDELKGRLAAPAHVAAVAAPAMPASPAHDFPWGMLALGALVIAAFVFFLRSMNRPNIVPAAVGPAYGAGGGYGQAYGGGYGPVGPAPAAGGMGSGILGGLATGAALGAGMVAGEALMHKVLDGGHRDDAASLMPQAQDIVAPSDYDMGGSDFGVADGSSWDDASGGGGSDDWN